MTPSAVGVHGVSEQSSEMRHRALLSLFAPLPICSTQLQRSGHTPGACSPKAVLAEFARLQVVRHMRD